MIWWSSLLLIIISEPPWYIAPLFAANVFYKVVTFYFLNIAKQGRNQTDRLKAIFVKKRSSISKNQD